MKDECKTGTAGIKRRRPVTALLRYASDHRLLIEGSVGPVIWIGLGQAMREFLFHLPRQNGISLQGQIREMLVNAILEGHIPAGSPLPSGRKLAQQLDVARNTVVLAYQQLVDEGFLTARERSGYFVNPDILCGRTRPVLQMPVTTASPPQWHDRLIVKPSQQRNVTKPYDWQRYPYPFVYGQFDPALFPIADWRESCRLALSPNDIRDWAGDRIDRDDPILLEQIQSRVLPRRGVLASPDQILITVGAQHALFLLANLLITDQHTVGIEDPGYADARNIFSMRTQSLVGLAMDDEGLVVNQNLARCDYVYVTPSHQYPTTVTMTKERRQALLQQAAKSDVVIIEDDYESETNYVGQPTAALKSSDTSNRVIYVGSLSKTLAPGLRLGYMVGPTELIREARALRRLMLRHPPANNQRSVAMFLKLGHHDSLVRRLSHAYKDRWKAMGEALARHLPESTQMPTFGGTSYWAKGPHDLDAAVLADQAAQRGILIERGDVHFLRGEPRNHFRLGFSSISSDRIDPGVAKLAELIHRLAGQA